MSTKDEIKVRLHERKIGIQWNHLPQIDFDPQLPEHQFDVEDRRKFWESTREWFLHRGYILYKMTPYRPPFFHCSPSMPNHDLTGGEFPYAFHDSGKGLDECYDSFNELQQTYSVDSLVRTFSSHFYLL